MSLYLSQIIYTYSIIREENFPGILSHRKYFKNYINYKKAVWKISLDMLTKSYGKMSNTNIREVKEKSLLHSW